MRRRVTMKKSMKKQCLSMISLLLLASLILTGCKSKSQDSTSPQSSTENQSSGPVEITVLNEGDTWDPNNAYLPIITEATNVKVLMSHVLDTDYDEKINVLAASGSLPNIIRMSYNSPMYGKYVSEGLFLPLDDMLDKYPKIRDAYPAEVWEANRAEDGHIYHLPRMSLLANYPNIFMFRADVLAEKNLPVPTTTDELRAVFEALKKDNPDPDYTPFVGNRNSLADIEPFLFAFGTGLNIWQVSEEDPSKLVYSTTTEKFKDALKFISDLRKDGLFEQQWYVGNERGIDKFYSGKAEFTMDPPVFVEFRIPEVQKVDPDAVIDYIPEFKGKNGELYGAVETFNAQARGMVVTKGTTPEQLEGIFRLVDYFFNGDGYDMFLFGVEGQNYTRVDGKIVNNPREEDPAEYDRENIERFDFIMSPTAVQFTRDIVPALVSDAQFNIASERDKEAYKNPILNYGSKVSADVITDNLSALNSLSEELITKAILTPNADVEALFKEYNEKLRGNKLDEVTEAMNSLNAPK